jgi:hypothetical protein
MDSKEDAITNDPTVGRENYLYVPPVSKVPSKSNDTVIKYTPKNPQPAKKTQTPVKSSGNQHS